MKVTPGVLLGITTALIATGAVAAPPKEESRLGPVVHEHRWGNLPPTAP